MKLNNKGWGTTEMILLSCGLLIALLVAAFFISQLFKSFNKQAQSNYLELETKLIEAGKNYVDNYNIEINDTFKVSSEILRLDGYINDLKDQDGNLCTGYVRVNNIDNILEYQGFIRCNNYESPNYSE